MDETTIDREAMGRLAKMGASDIDSVPPMIATSLVPKAMVLAASVSAWTEVAHARATVCASIFLGNPAAITTSRAMLGAVIVGTT